MYLLPHTFVVSAEDLKLGSFLTKSNLPVWHMAAIEQQLRGKWFLSLKIVIETGIIVIDINIIPSSRELWSFFCPKSTRAKEVLVLCTCRLQACKIRPHLFFFPHIWYILCIGAFTTRYFVFADNDIWMGPDRINNIEYISDWTYLL